MTTTSMPSGLRFLMAARRCEIEELAHLGRTVALVGCIGGLVHALQKERGLSNIFLGSGGTRFAAERTAQVAEAQAAEQAVRAALDRLTQEPQPPGSGTRLFNRVAWVLPGLDALAQLRARIGAGAVSPAQAAAAFAKLIGGLLAVVFEAADGATDPQISRQLVAMFNFMQGKEFAGQERAFGAAAFTRARADAELRPPWLHLIESQERCFEVFADFADETLRAQWQAAHGGADTAELERLRRIGCAAPGPDLDPELGPAWFACCTRRIDAMRVLEAQLAQGLRVLCDRKIAQAHAELQQYEALADGPGPAPQTGFFDDGDTGDAPAPASSAFGRQLERSVLDMVQAQARRLQAMSDELETVRAALNERKVVERAKGLLMAHRHLSEEEAHKMLRQTAMNQNRRLVEVAESVLTMAEYLPAR